MGGAQYLWPDGSYRSSPPPAQTAPTRTVTQAAVSGLGSPGTAGYAGNHLNTGMPSAQSPIQSQYQSEVDSKTAATNAEQQRQAQQRQQALLQQQQIDKNHLDLVNQQHALSQAYMMAGNSDNPRSSTGAEWEISNGGGANRSTSTKGSGGPSNEEIAALMGLMGGGGGAPTQPPPARTPLPAPVLEDPRAAFGMAKDTAGRTTNAAIKALRDLMTSRGMSDSGMEAEGEALLVGDAARQMRQAEFDALTRNTDRQNDFSQFGYTGSSNERGTDMDYTTAQQELAERRRQTSLDAVIRLLGLRY